MAVSQMRNGLTAENSLFSQKPSINVPRSRFDLSRPNFFTASTGMIVPVDVFQVMPRDEINLNLQYKIDFRPLLVPTLTSYKVKIHAYYCRSEFLWHGWESFITKGRAGNLALTVPKIKVSDLCNTSVKLNGLTDPNFKTADGSYFPYTPQSLLGYMLGSVPYDTKLVNDDGGAISSAVNDHYLPYGDSANQVVATGYKSLDANALPFLMYQKIYRSNYLDPNLMSNGTVRSEVWFPDDIDSSDWRISYSKDNIGGSYNHLFVPQHQTVPSPGTEVANFVPRAEPVNADNGDNCINLTQLRYAMYTDDMFTTALPFLQRGPQTALDLDVSNLDISGSLAFDYGLGIESRGQQLTSTDTTYTDSSYHLRNLVAGNLPVAVLQGTGFVDANPTHLGVTDSDGLFHRIVTKTSGSDISISSSGVSVFLTAQTIRTILALSIWQERNALTNGSYGQFIKVHFDSYPDNQYCEPEYIGGTTSVFNVNAVVQTSASVDGSTPQGNPVGIGGTSNRQNICYYRVPDWGYIMVLMMIIPDTVYTQSQDHMWFDEAPDDFYMPEYEKLSYQPILNKQLFVSGTSATDNDIFGYSNRYVYMKQREAIVRGRFGLPASIDKYYHSYVQSREFKDTPQLSQQFVTVYPPNLDRSYLAYPGEPEFICQFYSSVNAVRAMSYVSQPNTFGF